MDENQPLANSDETPAAASRRRPRFRLGLLLLLLLAICATLGGWHVYAGYLAPYVEAAQPAVAGKPVVIRGGYADFLGFDDESVVLNVSEVNPEGKSVVVQSANGRAKRRGLWSYGFEINLEKFKKSGEYEIEARPMTRSAHARRKYSPADSIFGKLLVAEPK